MLGNLGERLVVQSCSCPKCKRPRTLRALPPNFRCADVICDFCGYLAQVKAATVDDVERPPGRVLGAAWGPQEERMAAGIYFPLFLVLVNSRKRAIYYLPADLQSIELFEPRATLSEKARRSGWQGFVYRLDRLKATPVRIA
jgi:type II restriction enzyme